MTLEFIAMMVWCHFFADFVLQSDKMALNKSKSMKWLAYHSFVYAIPFAFLNPMFAFVTGLLHFFVDGITSKITSILWATEQRHWFFVMIGLDQALHITILFLTWSVFLI